MSRPTGEDGAQLDIGISGGAALLLVLCLIGACANVVITDFAFFESLPGFGLIFLFAFIGLSLTTILPFYMPAIAWVSLIGILSTIDPMPWSHWASGQLDKVSLMSLVSMVMAYAAFGISEFEIAIFRKSGVKILIVTVLVFSGTYIGSAAMANLFL